MGWDPHVESTPGAAYDLLYCLMLYIQQNMSATDFSMANL
ncbi:uncharacterized protein G2W53_038958 [Senna tora]|uniref:Uncharacterized protein n=1 Tax=Senna tora TaxID=362788 RepID=A0A834W2G1_9FABA|nr:uncharacterized protein G2W53_038958 [Senna tora]